MQVIDPGRLSAAARRSLIDQLFAVHARVFELPGKSEFARHVVEEPGATRTRIGLHRIEGRLVGYSAIHLFDVVVGGDDLVVMRGESGILEPARGGARMGYLWARELAGAIVRSCGPVYYFGAHVHPSAYLALGRLASGLSPRPDRLDFSLAQDIADAFHLTPDGKDPHVRHVGWVTRESDEDRRSWAQREDPLTRFYLRENPRYGEGFGLPVVARFGPLDLARAYASHALS